MDAKLRAKWVKVLRSGEYQQKFFNVGKGDKLCCVGVGGVVAGLKPDGGDKVGSAACWKALGLTTSQAQILFEMNDEKKKSFSEDRRLHRNQQPLRTQ